MRNNDYDAVRKVEVDGKKKRKEKSDGEFAIGGVRTSNFWTFDDAAT